MNNFYLLFQNTLQGLNYFKGCSIKKRQSSFYKEGEKTWGK